MMVFRLGQAGVSANHPNPRWFDAEDLEAADVVLEWKDGSDYRGIDVVVKVYELLAAAARVRLEVG